MNYELKQAERKQYDLWRQYNYIHDVCNNPKSTVAQWNKRAEVLEQWQASTELITKLKQD
jgi:hypothetical protein